MNILLIEDHPLFSKALETEIVQIYPKSNLVFSGTLADSLEILKTSFDLILLDLELPDSNGLLTLITITQVANGTPIIVVSGEDSPAIIQQALKIGAKGYIPKSAQDTVLRNAISLVMSGEIFVPSNILQQLDLKHEHSPTHTLTNRECEILNLMAEGFSNKKIGNHLCIEEATVRSHATHIFKKLSVDNRTEAVIKAQKKGLVT